MSATATNPKFCLMPGTGSGLTYLAFARQGSVALGVKPEVIAPGKMAGVPDTTLFAARVRSARVSADFWPKTKSKVVKLQKNPDDLAECWPQIKFTNKNKDRASTVVKAYMPGTPDGDPALRAKFEEEVGGGKIGEKMASYLVEAAGKDNLVLTEAEIAEWLNDFYAPILAQIKEAVAAKEAKKEAKVEAKSALIGQFGVEAAILKDKYKEIANGDEFDADHNGFKPADDGEEDDGGEEGDD